MAARRAFVAVLPMRAAAKDLFGELPRISEADGRAARVRGPDGRSWDAVFGLRQCGICLNMAFTNPSGQGRTERYTGGSPLATTAHASTQMGHRLWGFAIASAPTMFCA